LGALGFEDFNDKFSSKEETTKYEGRIEPTRDHAKFGEQIEKLKDHGLDLIIEKETPMLILNLTL
jgi:hypothetical protein